MWLQIYDALKNLTQPLEAPLVSMSKPSITDKQLVRLSKVDVQLGRPVAWNIYDEAGELLLSEGSVFNSQKQLAAMLEHGAYRKNRSSTPDLEKLREEEAKDRLAEAKRQTEDNRPLHKIPLSIGDIVQLQPLNDKRDTERLTSRLVGFVPGKSVIISTPVKDRKYIPLVDGQSYVIRLFSGKSVYAFVSHVVRQANVHCSYVHFSYPTLVRGIKLRNSVRANVNLIAHITKADASTASAKVHDLSIGGGRLVSRSPLGEISDPIIIKIKIKFDDHDEYIQIQAIIRSAETTEDGRETGHGVQFVDMQPEHKLALSAFMYKFLLIEDDENRV